MFIVTIIVSALLALVFTFSGVNKLNGNKEMHQVRDRLHIAPKLWLTIGALEIAAAVGLLVGLKVAALGVAAAAGLVLLMAGAIVAHLRARDPGKEVMPPATLLIVAVAALVLRLVTI
jgi:uncharacterized membrane protein YphA (DoxX/SURF4 family)